MMTYEKVWRPADYLPLPPTITWKQPAATVKATPEAQTGTMTSAGPRTFSLKFWRLGRDGGGRFPRPFRRGNHR